MQRQTLGSTGLEITPLGLALCDEHGDPPDSAAQQATIKDIREALRLGITWVLITGHCETTAELLGAALSGQDNVPMIGISQHLSIAEQRLTTRQVSGVIHEKMAKSLATLQRHRHDLHFDLCELVGPLPSEVLRPLWYSLAALRLNGKVRALGLSEISFEQLRILHALAPIDLLRVHCSLLERELDQRLLDFCAEHGIKVIASVPAHEGLLSEMSAHGAPASLQLGERRPEDYALSEPYLSRSLALAELLRIVALRHASSVAEVALAWTLQQPAIAAALVSPIGSGQLRALAGRGPVRLDELELRELDAFFAQRWNSPLAHHN